MTTDARDHLRSDLWPVGTKLRLLSVPWDEGYRDVVAWTSASQRDAWFESQYASQQAGTWTSDRFNYLRPGEPVAVPVPYSTAYRYNYLAVTNPMQPVDDEGAERTFYYFVTGVTYLAPQTSLLDVQLDVMTTFAGDVTLGRAFVERGHVALANENARGDLTGQKLNDYLSIPEGIDVGSQYVPCHREVIGYMGKTADRAPKIVILSTANLAADPGTITSPNLNVADGQDADCLPTGCNVYWIHAAEMKRFMAEMQDKSWVAQCILSIYLFPGPLLSAGPEVKLFGGDFTMHFLGETETFGADSEVYAQTTDVIGKLDEGLGSYADLAKLHAYPYSVIEATTLTGNPVYLKPQLVNGNTLDWYWLGAALMPFARACFFARNYGTPYAMADVEYSFFGIDGNEHMGLIPAGDFMDSAVWVLDFPQFAIVNNNYITYLASTANTRAYQYESAGWMLDRSNASAAAAYQNMMYASENVGRQADIRGEAMARQYGINAAGTMLGVAIPDLGGTGNILNVAGNLASAAVQGATTLNNLTALGDATTSTRTMMGNVAENNRNLAEYANQGDYQNRVAGIDATVQDAALRPPSTVGQMGGNGFNWKNGLGIIQLTWKTISGAALAAAGDYFRRYGYAVRRWLPLGEVSSLLCMSHFAYWKVLETTVTAAHANESERQTIRGVFEKGVTLWATPEDIGTTSLAENHPIAGFSY